MKAFLGIDVTLNPENTTQNTPMPAQAMHAVFVLFISILLSIRPTYKAEPPGAKHRPYERPI